MDKTGIRLDVQETLRQRPVRLSIRLTGARILRWRLRAMVWVFHVAALIGGGAVVLDFNGEGWEGGR